MKHSTPELMKFKRLQRRLGVPRVVAVGTLELLWISTANNARRGDIGRFSNEEIAIEVDWEGDPDHLVQCLVDTGWLDRCDTHRLVVHDWKSHAPRYVHAWVKSQKTTFAEPVTTGGTVEGTIERTTEATIGRTTEGGIPNQTKPHPTKPHPTKREERGKPAARPTLDEVRDYIQERKSDIDPEAFFAYYEANGWRQSNGNKIRSWRQCVTTWEKNGFGSGKQIGNNKPKEITF